jgi:tetratricopeptide (TPR) repeat protein
LVIVITELLQVIEKFLKEKKWEKAGAKLNQLEQEEKMDKYQKMESLLLKSKYLVKTFNFQDAEPLLKTVLNKSPDLNNKIFLIDCYLILADLAKGMGNLDQGLNNLNKVRDLLRENDHIQNNENWFREEYLNDLEGNILIQKGEFDSALKNFEERLRIATNLNDNYLLYYSYNHLGMIYRIWGKYRLALKNYQQGLQIAENLNDNHLLSQSFSILGFSYGKLGKFKLAIEYGRKGVDLARNTNNIILMNALNNLGANYWANGFLNEALSYINEAIEVAKKIGNQKGLADHYNNMGLIFYSKGNLNQSLHYYKSALKIKREFNDTEGQRNILGNIGQAYAELGNYDLAIDYYNKGLELYKLIENNLQLATLLLDLCSLFLKNHKFEKAQETVNDLQKLSEETDEEIITNRYLIAQANLWSAGMNPVQKKIALQIYTSIADDDVTQYEIYFSAHLHICEMLFESYIETNDKLVLKKLNHYLQKILTKSEEENLFYMKNSSYLLMGRLELLHFNAIEANAIIGKVKEEAESRGYDTLTKHSISDLETVKEYNALHKIISLEKLGLEKERFLDKQKQNIQIFISEIVSKKVDS